MSILDQGMQTAVAADAGQRHCREIPRAGGLKRRRPAEAGRLSCGHSAEGDF
jgi:hypothetical protein